MNLYAVVSVSRRPFYRKDGTSYISSDSRTILITANDGLARDMVLANSYDLHEAGYYPYVVIEQMEEGAPYGLGPKGSGRQWWFHWRGPIKGGRYRVMARRPKWAEKIFQWWG